jgi:hopanoid biosynthesis associated RND transporter like protein HpnN
MIQRAIICIVDFCARHKWTIIVVASLLMFGSAAFDAARFSINTDVESLINQDLPWHKRQVELNEAFPQRAITVIVHAPTTESAELATDLLADKLRQEPDFFYSATQPESGEYFEKNGLLYQSLSDLRNTTERLTRGQPLLASLDSDPSLRGIMKALSFVADLAHSGTIQLDQLAWPLSMAENSLQDAITGRRVTFSWQELLEQHALPARRLRHFIEVAPRLNFSALQPGQAAAQAIRQAALDLDLNGRFGASLQLTGRVPMNDDQFSVVRKSALRDTLAALGGVLLVLWLGLRSWKIIASVFFSLIVGLAVTAALGLLLVRSFNLISIAFFVLFVGLGVDFGIQLSVRYRTERHELDDFHAALRSAAGKAGAPLALAAAATAVGFFSFLPTSYVGLSELGLIAGCGMLVAFTCSITVLPAMLTVLRPPGEAAPMGFSRLAPLDDVLQRHRIAVIAGTTLVVLAGSPLLAHLRFDFNPIDLQSPSSPSVVAYRELLSSPQTSGNDAEILAPSIGEANRLAARLAQLPEVSRTVTLSSFVPDEQDEKIGILRKAAQSLSTALDPESRLPPPTDQQNVAAIQQAAEALARAAGSAQGPAADRARSVSSLLTQLAAADRKSRTRLEAALARPLIYDLDLLRESLSPKHVTLETLSPHLVRDWMLPDGRARLEIIPKGNSSSVETLRSFASAVLSAVPTASGPAISFYESGRTATKAFAEAGILALVAISILLALALRRVTDVLLTLIPLIVAATVTLEIAVLWGLALNFANIIALPLLLGVGVAFKIYYVMAWRAGKTGLLQSTLTRAVVFSAMTNAIAFGSMWASEYPGMSTMGKMMALALVCTMAAAVLFQPVLMGPPRQATVPPDARPDSTDAAV